MLTLDHRWNESHKTTVSLHGVRTETDGGNFILFNFEGPVQDPVTGDVSRAAERIDFTGGSPFNMHDIEQALFAQDHWMLSPKIALDLGIRTESQALSESFRIAPRAGVAWTPAVRTGAAKRSGPTRSSKATAGRLSDRRSASAAVMLPAKPRSKFSGA